MAVEITLRLGSVTPTAASGITMGEPAYNTVDNRLFIGKGYGITAAWVGAPISNDYLQIAAGLTQQIPTLSAVKDYVNYIGTIGATGATGTQGVQGVTGSTGAQGNTGPVGDYVISFNGGTGAVTFSSYVVSVNGVTGAIVSVGLTSGKLSQFASTTSAELAGVVSDETGSGGVLVFNSSPSITTAINTASASFNLLNTTATSLFIGSAATTGRIFGYTGVLATTQSVTVAGANTGSGVNKTVNIGTGSGLNGTVTINVGQSPTEGTGIINLLSNTAVSGTLSTSGSISAPNIVNSFNGITGAVTFSSYVTSFNGITGAVTGITAGGANTFTALNSFSAGLSASGATFSGDIAVNGGDITTTSATATLYNTTATTVNIGNAAGTVSVMGGTANARMNIGSSSYIKTGQTTTTTTAKQEIFRYASSQASVFADTFFADLIITANRTIIGNNPNNQITKMLVVTSLSATINHTEYGNVNTGGNLAVYTAELSGLNVIIYATPTTTESTVFAVYATLIKGTYGFNFEE